MQNLRETGFVDRDTLTFFEDGSKIKLEGEVSCLGGIIVSVVKTLDTIDSGGKELWVQTSTYSYNATVAHWGNIIRVGNTHPMEGYADDHHINRYEWRTGEQLKDSPEWIGSANWPTLGRFIGEWVKDWYDENGHELPTPFQYGRLDLRD